jgi:membrane protein implicated in regulation of membrane protease activity
MPATVRVHLVAACLATMAAGPAAAQNPYVRVKFSLGVPWTLYFVFLALISIPFAVMILLAWRRGRSEEDPQEPRRQESAGAAERPAGK